MELGNELRRFRFVHGEISQQELANAIGVARLTIHSIETGKFVPDADFAQAGAVFRRARRGPVLLGR